MKAILKNEVIGLVFIGLVFEMQGGFWRVASFGTEGWVGVVNLKTSAFTSEKIETILDLIKK